MTLPLKDSKNDKWLVSEEQKRTQKGKISSMKFSSHTDSDKHCMDKKKISKKRRRNTLSEEQNKQDLLRTIDLKESYLNDTYESKKKDEHQDSLRINSQKKDDRTSPLCDLANISIQTDVDDNFICPSCKKKISKTEVSYYEVKKLPSWH